MHHMNQSPTRERRVIARLKLYNRYDMFKLDVAIVIAAASALLIIVWGY